MKNWFDALEARDRLIVVVGAFVVAFVLIYVMAWAPLASKHERMKTDVENWQRSLSALGPIRDSAANGGQSQSGSVIGSQQSPLIIVDQTLRSRGLDRYRQTSQPTASNGVRVVFENVAFDELVLWLGDLSEQYSMHVQVGTFGTNSQAEPGRVNATMTLEPSL